MEFQKWPPIPRLRREMVITEKLDGTNAQVTIVDLDDPELDGATPSLENVVCGVGRTLIYAGSRKRWITPDDDNYGFARWVHNNAADLVALGHGSHYGEWWGAGIQRGYDLGEKRFSLFNTGRWNDENTPDCVSVVPVLYEGGFDTDVINDVMRTLQVSGSIAAPGFMNPEGVAVYHTAAGTYFKQTFEHDHDGKPV